MAAIDRAPPSDPPGASFRVPGFRIVSELGRGGMGIVYEGWDEKLLRRVALKLMPVELAGDADLRERFLREARAAAALTHPNIATIFAVETCDDGRPLLVMELVSGRSLRARLAAGRVPLAEARTVALGIAAALAKAHAVGIVHRDLKPENVMVGDDGQVKLLDFGIAKALDRGPSLDTSGRGLTATGQVVGTAGYVAPEQVEGLENDQRVDVFAFGVVLFELLAGSLPFDGATAVQRMVAVLRDAPADLGALAPEAPAALRELTLRCLAKSQEGRPLDGNVLSNELAKAWPELTATTTPAEAAREIEHARTEPHSSLVGVVPTEGVRALTTPITPLDPAPLPTNPAGAVDPRPKKSRDRVIVAMCLVAGFATLLVLRLLRDDVPPRSETRRSGASGATTERATTAGRGGDLADGGREAPPASEAEAAGEGIPTAFRCGDRGGEGTFETVCSSEHVAWCDPAWKRIACCADGLVPHDAEGACGCPPGGNAEADPVRPGCQRGGASGLPREVVQGVMGDVLKRAGRDCYGPWLESVPEGSGSVTVAMRIAPNGRVFSARVAESSIADPGVQRCALDRTRAAVFPPPRGSRGVELSYPIRFTPR